MSLNIAERRPLLNGHHNNNRPTRNRISSLQRSLLRPVPPSPTALNVHRQSVCRTRIACCAILLSLVFERIAFYGLAGNLVLFLNKDPLRWESYHAIDASLYFFGLCFATSWIGGLLADVWLGRFKALVISFVIYMMGYVLMPLMTVDLRRGQNSTPQNDSLTGLCKMTSSDHHESSDDADPFDERCATMIYITLLLIAVGTGFVKANIAPFGSDQVASEGQQATLSFFNWFYWSINLGAFVGLAAITYIEQQMSFFYGYVASACCLGLSALLFISAYFNYRVRAPSGSVIQNIFGIIKEACRRRRQHRQILAATGRSGNEADCPETQLSFLDYAQHRHGGMFHDGLVEDVRQLKKIFAVFAVLIPYWLVYFQLVAAWFALFDVIMLIILLPLFDRVIYPWIERRTGRPVSISRRILLGMGFATAAMIAAGVLEHYRLKVFWPYPDQPCKDDSINQTIGGTTYHAADLTILWQIPQYALIGLSEVFTSVAGLQFAVSVAPRSMKGIIMGMFYLFSGIGSFLGTAFIISLSSSKIWFLAHDYGDINCRMPCLPHENYVTRSCHLDYYFYLLAGIEVCGIVLFLLVARVFQLDEHHRQSRIQPQTETSDSSGDAVLDPAPDDPRQPHSVQRHRMS